MAKPVTKVKRTLLTSVIEEVESDGPLGKLSDLQTAVADLYNAKLNDADRANGFGDITHSIVYLRVKEWNLETKTKPGKRGRQKGQSLPEGFGGGNTGTRQSKAEKFANNPDFQEWLDSVERHAVTPRVKAKVQKLRETGSRALAVEVKCLMCSGELTKEVRHCPVKGCALWGFRPYQGAVEADEDTDSDADDVESEAA